VGRLTPYQVRWIYFRTDEDNEEFKHRKNPDYTGPLTAKRLFWHIEKEVRGRSEEEVQKLWDESVRAQKERDRKALLGV